MRKDYDFTGWNTAADGSGTAYEADSDLKVTEPVTLYAQWKKHEEPAPKPGKTDVTKTVKKAKNRCLQRAIPPWLLLCSRLPSLRFALLAD